MNMFNEQNAEIKTMEHKFIVIKEYWRCVEIRTYPKMTELMNNSGIQNQDRMQSDTQGSIQMREIRLFAKRTAR